MFGWFEILRMLVLTFSMMELMELTVFDRRGGVWE